MPVGHDQIWKELIQAFPADFVALTLPEVAERIDLEQLDFKPEEHFLDTPRGRHLHPDLVAQVRSRATPHERAVLHAEVELRFRSRLPSRWLQYHRALCLRYGAPVHTVATYLRGGPPGLARRVHHESSLGCHVTTFHFTSFGLSRASADDYLARPEPLAWAMAALMRPRRSPRQRAELRTMCLRRIAVEPDLSDEQRFRLFNCVRTYIELDRAAEEEYEKLLVEHAKEVPAMAELITTWAESMEMKGYREGERAGRREGRLEATRELTLQLLTERFGSLPARIAEWIDRITSPEELTRLAKRAQKVRSLGELGLD